MNITKCSRSCNISPYICIHVFPDFNAKALEQVSHSAPSQPVALHVVVVSKEHGPTLGLIDQFLSHWLQPISPSCLGLCRASLILGISTPLSNLPLSMKLLRGPIPMEIKELEEVICLLFWSLSSERLFRCFSDFVP